MKIPLFIVVLASCLVLGVSSALAATAGYWKRSGSGYVCEGVNYGVSCRAGGFQVGVTKDYVFIKKGSFTYGCKKWMPAYECFGG